MSTDLVHVTARARRRTLLFHTWTEALELWRRLMDAFPDALAICVMPNHIHLLAPVASTSRLGGVMSGYARWRAHHRGGEGGCWEPAVAPEPLADDDERRVRRTIRYIHLNPCRGDLAGDPLGWPLSTHRDATGFGEPARRVREPARLHHYVSSDPKVSVVGTPLPERRERRALSIEIEAAVGGILRLEPGEVRVHPNARRLCVRAGRAYGHDIADIGEWLGMRRSQLFELARPLPGDDPREKQVEAVIRAVGDPRFAPLALPPRVDPTVWSGWRQRGSFPK